MKRFIINILVFFGMVIAIDICVGFTGDYLLSHAKGGETKTVNDLVVKDFHDVVVLGSSRARHHYDAPFLSDTLSVDVYNAGYDGNGVILSYELLSMMLERYHPKLIIYDVEPSFDIFKYKNDNNNKRYISFLKPYYRHTGVAEAMKDVSKEEWYKAHSGLLRYNTRLLVLIVDNILSRKTNNAGYIPLQGEYISKAPKYKSVNRTKVEYDEFKLFYVSKLITLAQSSGVPIVFVASPKYNKESSEEIEPVKKICAQYGVPFLDFYSDRYFNTQRKLFKEPMHLNSKGAREFSRVIVKEIKKFLS